MRYIIAVLVLIFLGGCASRVPYRNERPMTPLPPAHELIPKCEIAVQFNEDEASVPESDYLDGMFCLGFMEGIMGTNAFVSASGPALFCPPDPGIKTWIAAKAVVDFAKTRPELLGLVETDFALQALAHTYPCNER